MRGIQVEALAAVGLVVSQEEPMTRGAIVARRLQAMTDLDTGTTRPARVATPTGADEAVTDRHRVSASLSSECLEARPPRILLVEDNAHYATALRNNLEIDGFEVDIASDATAGVERMQSVMPALVVLDVMLPGRDGYELLRQMRDNGIDVPVVMLTARRDETDKLRGFGLGADDFITKPVSILELIARIRAVLRRAHPRLDTVALWIRFGDIEVHPGTRTVRRQGKDVDLRPKEFDLLLALLRHQDRIVSRAELLRDVWGYQADTVSRTVDTHMAGLRQKLEDDPLEPRYFITVRSVGYMMRRTAETRDLGPANGNKADTRDLGPANGNKAETRDQGPANGNKP
jgi:DNA-binding response OmpR family regulator